MDNTGAQLNMEKEEGIGAGMVHLILSHSYSVFMMAVVFGLILDVFIPFYIFNDVIYQYIGAGMIIFGSIIIYWAQSSSNRSQEQTEKGEARNFEAGPYKYSRNPTHIGLSIMTLGLAFVLNSVFSLLLTLVASLITKLIFLKKEESLLEKKYGEPYLNYKKKVRTWV
jgi:protein-S-isoprenylcysteine O-methyltransferase Ste14